jgi:hypothetical protein
LYAVFTPRNSGWEIVRSVDVVYASWRVSDSIFPPKSVSNVDRLRSSRPDSATVVPVGSVDVRPVPRSHARVSALNGNPWKNPRC